MPHTLLLADDSVTIQRVIELTFADEDVKVVAVSDGNQAIERLESAPPDIVLADIGMPGKNGYEVAQYIKQSPRLSHIPVVLLTGAFEPVDQARAAEAGCDGVLAKPFEPQMVIGRVKELLSKPKAGLDAALSPPAPLPDQWAPRLLDQGFPGGSTPVPHGPADVSAYFDRLDAAFETLSSPAASKPAPSRPPDSGPVAPELAPIAAAVAQEIEWFSKEVAGTATEAPNVPLSYASPKEAFDSAQAEAFDSAQAEAFDSAQAVAFDSVQSVAFDVQKIVALDAAPATVAAAEPPPPAPESIGQPGEASLSSVAVGSPVEPEKPVEGDAPVARESPVDGESPMEREASVERPAIPALPEKPIAMPALADAFAALLAAEQNDPEVVPIVWPSSAPSTDVLVDRISRRVLDHIAERADTVLREAVADLVSERAERLIKEEIERIKASIK